MTADRTLLGAVSRAVAARTPLGAAAVERVTVGDRLVLVEVVDDGVRAAGVAHRPPGTFAADVAGRRAIDVAGLATAPDGGAGERAAGEPATDPRAGVATSAGDDRDAVLRRAVGVATLNALSAPLVAWRTGDPFERLGAGVSTIATVGLFGPAFRKFGALEVRVVERRDVTPPETPEGVSVSVYGADEAETAFASADVVFVTGSSLLYGGTEAYLDAARAAGVPSLVLIGATASFVPEPAFEAGATVLAGARVTDAAAVRAGALAGECATDLHEAGLEKVFVTNDGATRTGFDLG